MILEIFNRKLKKNCLSYSVLIIHGNRGSGKSTLMALLNDEAIKQSREVYCQYPYRGAHQIPLIKSTDKGVLRLDVDKEWLYSNAFPKGSVIILDESSTIWPARSFAKWSERDSEFFNFVRKQEITVILGCQYIDTLDLNVRRSADGTYFLNDSIHVNNFSIVEESKTFTVKIADKNTEILGEGFKRGAQKIIFDVCEIPVGRYRFYRKPYYGKFDSYYVPFNKVPQPQPLWDETYFTT